MSHRNEKGPKRVGDFLFPYSLCSKDLPMTAIALASVSQEDTTPLGSYYWQSFTSHVLSRCYEL